MIARRKVDELWTNHEGWAFAQALLFEGGMDQDKQCLLHWLTESATKAHLFPHTTIWYQASPRWVMIPDLWAAQPIIDSNRFSLELYARQVYRLWKTYKFLCGGQDRAKHTMQAYMGSWWEGVSHCKSFGMMPCRIEVNYFGFSISEIRGVWLELLLDANPGWSQVFLRRPLQPLAPPSVCEVILLMHRLLLRKNFWLESSSQNCIAWLAQLQMMCRSTVYSTNARRRCWSLWGSPV